MTKSLKQACCDNNLEEVLEIIQLEGNVSAQGGISLHYAVYNGNFEIAKLLIDNGVDINQRINQGGTYYSAPLDTAARHFKNDIGKLLLEKGADVNVQDHRGESPLYGAVKQNNVDFIKLLLAYGADPNIPEYFSGATPLMEAASGGNVDIVTLLLKHGSDKTIISKGNNFVKSGTAIDYALANGHEKIVKLIKKYGEKRDCLIDTANRQYPSNSKVIISNNSDNTKNYFYTRFLLTYFPAANVVFSALLSIILYIVIHIDDQFIWLWLSFLFFLISSGLLSILRFQLIERLARRFYRLKDKHCEYAYSQSFMYILETDHTKKAIIAKNILIKLSKEIDMIIDAEKNGEISSILARTRSVICLNKKIISADYILKRGWNFLLIDHSSFGEIRIKAMNFLVIAKELSEHINHISSTPIMVNAFLSGNINQFKNSLFAELDKEKVNKHIHELIQLYVLSEKLTNTISKSQDLQMQKRFPGLHQALGSSCQEGS